ncbi:unnamed protein product [Rhizoctonia solani]|uniref:Fungal-type protein kinase domain-containing protein n=1 Tax=Rhizoctonia solani TaxID=456999 RepID=A0A8H3BLG1_9AGAM|nr:unnamed protein product [Rhizoctonia solani]
MLDRIDEGLDPAFTFRRNEDGRLVYYIDLPESELEKTSAESSSNEKASASTSERMRRFKVIERLCHRESICDRATIVLRIQEVLEPEEQVDTNMDRKCKQSATKKSEPREYALKLMWRDPDREPEGDVLEQVYGVFGLVQHAGHWDASMPGKCRCATPVTSRCKEYACLDKTVEVSGLEVCSGMKDINVNMPDEKEGEEEPGYWGLFNLGIMHRDVSNGNVMMVRKGQIFNRRKWKEEREIGSDSQERVFVESKMLHKVLKDLKHRDPTGMLSDFDLHARHFTSSDQMDSA